jgi:fucokinase
MFTHLIVTAPTEKAAEVYRFQLNDLKGQLVALASTELYCVADPQGDRVGSGGGTLNAIHYLFEISGAGTIPLDAKVLVVHSGGDSRRIPIHSGLSCL